MPNRLAILAILPFLLSGSVAVHSEPSLLRNGRTTDTKSPSWLPSHRTAPISPPFNKFTPSGPDVGNQTFAMPDHEDAPSPLIDIPVTRGDVSLMGVSGNAILDRCTKQSDRDQEYCLAWMRLALDNRKSLKAIVPDLPDCIPQEVDDTQLRDVAVVYLRAHPKDRHLAATPLVAEAFIEAWPCQTGKKRTN
jgi:Rap1a immunity proteins